MSYESRAIVFLGREDGVKHYDIALGHSDPRPALTDATRRAAADAIPAGSTGLRDVPMGEDEATYLDRALEQALV